jgi:Caenorhabditis protein of unknown function, DUF268
LIVTLEDLMPGNTILNTAVLVHRTIFARGSLRQKAAVLRDYREYRKACGGDDAGFPITRYKTYPRERNQSSGTMRGHYFHQDLYVASRISKNNPTRHIDIGSRVDGFVAHVASFRDIEVLDIRPQTEQCHSIQFRQANLLELAEEFTQAADSVSCLHTIEHIGLGRYGDPVDPSGHRKAMRALGSMVKPGGTLYVSTPIGPQRLEFHAHRVFGVPGLIEMLEQETDAAIKLFSYVDDRGDFHEDVDWRSAQASSHFGCRYGCGIVELVKPDA